MNDSIKCPKCGSDQLSTDKKGFSGKKAVAGAVLTGGIGLLAGTIGSNKVIITCLKCGNQFRPGEDMDAKNKKDLQRSELNAKIAKNPVFKVVLKVVFGLLAFMILLIIILSIFDHSDNKTVLPTTSISDSVKSELDKYYIIEKEDIVRPTQRNLSVFIADTSKIKQINTFLISKYNKDKSNYMSISYFDKKGIAKIYDDKIMSNKTSDVDAEKLYKHLVANYDFNPSNSYEKLQFMHHKK